MSRGFCAAQHNFFWAAAKLGFLAPERGGSNPVHDIEGCSLSFNRHFVSVGIRQVSGLVFALQCFPPVAKFAAALISALFFRIKDI